MTRSALLAALALATPAFAQVGPDMICSGHVDVARYGTDPTGQITAYATGSVSCNRGDEPAIVSTSSTAGNIRPEVAQNMYMLATYPAAQGGTYTRLEQIGQSWAKRVGLPISGTATSCGSCQSAPSGMMGINCADIYGSGFNGNQSLLGPRSTCNPTLGTCSGGFGTAVGDSISRGRIQVPTAVVVHPPANARFFVENIILVPDDAQHVRPGQTVAVNGLNNASIEEININGGTGTPVLMGNTAQIPAVQRWREIDPQVVLIAVDHDDTPNPSPEFPGTFIRSRFYVAARTTALPGNQWRYEYAIFNLNSDRAAQAFSIPMADAGSVEGYTFSHPLSHSGEPYSNAPWPAARVNNQLTLATATFASNPNANAIRWGTTYSFGFTSNVPPAIGTGTLTLFKGASTDLPIPGLPVPTLNRCPSDYNNDGIVGGDADIDSFFACLAGQCCTACFVGRSDYNLDGDYGTDQDIESFFRVLAGGGC